MNSSHRFLTTIVTLWVLMVNLFGQVPKMMQPPRLVNDYVNILPSTDLSQIESKLVQFDKKTSIQVAVVIVETTGERPISDMAFDIGQTWGVGQKGLDNGVVFLIAIKNQKMFIATGYGIEGYLPDLTCYRICEETVKPFFKDGDYPGGIKAGVVRIVDALGKISWEERAEQKRILEEQRKKDRQEVIENIVKGLIVALLIGLLLILYSRSMKRLENVRVKKDRIESLKKFFNKILRDKVDPEASWPSWAKKAFAEYSAKYLDLYNECNRLLHGLPSSSGDIYRLEHDHLELIKKKLDDFDKIDREVTKIREDVKLYKERAPQALKEAKERLEKTRATVTSLSEHHTTSAFDAELDRLKTILYSLTLNTADDFRTVFEKAFGVSQKLKVMEGQITDEETLRERLVREQPSLKQKLAQQAPKWISEYGRLYGQLNRDFSGTSVQDFITLAVLMSMYDRAKGKTLEAQRAMDSATPLRYAMANASFGQASKDCDDIEQQLLALRQQLDQIEHAKKFFENQVVEFGELVKKATKVVRDSDVGRTARQAARAAVASLDKAETLSKLEKPDWLGAQAALKEAESSARRAIREANQDIADAKETRYSSNYSSSSTHYSSGSSGFSISGGGGGGGFGGFGGGSFGGGGGGSSW